MRAYLIAHGFLAPFILFTIGAPLGYPLTSAIIGLLIGLVICGYNYGLRIPPVFMSAQLLGLIIVILFLLFSSPRISENNALAVVFTCLAVGAFISVFQGKPWTAELSAGEMGDFAKNPAFIKANNFFSTMWAVIYAWFAFATWQELSPWLRWVPLAVGGLITVFGPKVLMRIGIKRGLFEDPRTSK